MNIHKDILRKLLDEYLDPQSFINLISTCKNYYELSKQHKAYRKIRDIFRHIEGNDILTSFSNIKSENIIGKIIYNDLPTGVVGYDASYSDINKKKMAMILSAEVGDINWFHWFRKNINYVNSGITNAEFSLGLEVAIAKSNTIELVQYIEKCIQTYDNNRVNVDLCYILRNAIIYKSDKIIDYLRHKCQIGNYTVEIIIENNVREYVEKMTEEELRDSSEFFFRGAIRKEDKYSLKLTLKHMNKGFTRWGLLRIIADELSHKSKILDSSKFIEYLFRKINIKDFEFLEIIYDLLLSLTGPLKWACRPEIINYVYSKIGDDKSPEYIHSLNKIRDFINEMREDYDGNYLDPWLDIFKLFD